MLRVRKTMAHEICRAEGWEAMTGEVRGAIEVGVGDVHQQVAVLEAEIDTLRDRAERCRKIDIGGKAALGMGCAMLLVGFLWLNPLPLVIGIALILGSVALLGSNRTTLGATITSITMLEERRVQMINGLELQTVSEGPAPSRNTARMPRWIGSGGPKG